MIIEAHPTSDPDSESNGAGAAGSRTLALLRKLEAYVDRDWAWELAGELDPQPPGREPKGRG